MTDERVPRERAHIAMRVINLLRAKHEVVTFRGDMQEDELLKALGERQFSLVLVPWYRYLAWTKVEGFFGISRTSGPTFAGYFADHVMPYEVSESTDYVRTILLDFAGLEAAEAATHVSALIHEEQRTGLHPLLTSAPTSPKPKIYTRTWYQGDTLGQKIDDLIAIPEILNTEWADRTTQLKVCMLGLWALVFEARGKTEKDLQPTREVRAYFQVGIEEKALFLRLCYGARLRNSPKDLVSLFWPNPKEPHTSTQLMLSNSDFVRAHTIADTLDIEITVGFYASTPATRFPGRLRTLWVEPIAQTLVRELPGDQQDPAGVPQPGAATGDEEDSAAPPASPPTLETQKQDAKDRYILNAALRIKDLMAQLEEKDTLIRELRTGGIGSAQQLAVPDPEVLLETFQERFLASRLEVETLELQVEDAARKGATAEELNQLKNKLVALTGRETQWITKVIATIELVKQHRKKAG